MLTFRSDTVSWSDTLLSSPLPRWPLWSNPGFPTNHMTARSDHVVPRKFDTSYQLVCTSHKNSDLWPFYEASSGFIAKAEARFRRQTRKMVPQCVSAATRSTWVVMKPTESEPVACLRQQEWCLHQSKTQEKIRSRHYYRFSKSLLSNDWLKWQHIVCGPLGWLEF